LRSDSSSSASISRQCVAPRAVRGDEPELVEERAIGVDVGVAGGEQALAVEDRVRAGEVAKRLHCIAELAAPRRKADHRARHHDPRHGDRAHELERIERRVAPQLRVQRRALDLHEVIDRHRLGLRRKRRQLRDQRGAIAP
jgi:hypothetical protein